MKLYKIICCGMTSSHGTSYVVAKNPDEAYKKVRKYLDENKLGLRGDREMQSIELIADIDTYPECGCRLYL